MQRRSSAPIVAETVALSELRGGQTKRRSAEAVRLWKKAERHELTAEMFAREGETHSAFLEQRDAERTRAEAAPLLDRVGETGRLLEGAGEAAILDRGPQGMTLHPNIATVLEYPNSIAVEASQRRMELATQAEALEPALDAAVAGQAGNSLDRMLLHQMGTAHVHAMKCFEMSMSPHLPPVEQTRYLNTAARMMDGYQNGMLVLHRLRTGGKQAVTVKHVVVHQQVQVNEGGRAVIAGTVKQRRRGGRGRKNGRIGQPE